MKISKSLILTLLMPLFSVVPAFAGGGDAVNNGGGASEMTIVYVHQNYGSLVEVCTRTKSCDLTADEQNLLAGLISSLPSEQAIALEFKPGADLGPRLFSTGSAVASRIEINKDLLWKTDLFGALQSYSLSDALEVLTLAWGQHQPQFSESTQTSLAQKVAKNALVGRALYLPYLQSPNLRLLTIQYQTVDQLYLDDGYDSFLNLHQAVLQHLPCNVSEFSVYSFQWSPVQLHENGKTRILLNGRIGWKCDDFEMVAYTASLGVSFRIEPITSSFNSPSDLIKGSMKMVDQAVELNVSNIKQAL